MYLIFSKITESRTRTPNPKTHPYFVVTDCHFYIDSKFIILGRPSDQKRHFSCIYWQSFLLIFWNLGIVSQKYIYIYIWILLMCALRAHIKLSVFRNIFSRIEKVMTAFLIPEKIFPKTKNLICTLRTHINRTLLIIHLSPFTIVAELFPSICERIWL